MPNINEVTTMEQKITAAQIEKNCPDNLEDLGKRINTQYDKARKSDDRADNLYTTVAQCLAKAKELCDDGGFEALRNKFFPNLKKTRVNELLQIGTGKKTVEQIRGATLRRVKKQRDIASAKALEKTISQTDGDEARNGSQGSNSARNSVTVTAKPGSKPAEEASTGWPSDIEATRNNTSSEQLPDLSPAAAVAEFDKLVPRLMQLTQTLALSCFIDTSVDLDTLEELSSFVTYIIEGKQQRRSTSETAGETSAEQPVRTAAMSVGELAGAP